MNNSARTHIVRVARLTARHAPYALLALGAAPVVFGLTSCGGGKENEARALTPRPALDLTNPRAVAAAYAASKFRCGSEGAGVRYDVSITTSPAGRWSREEYLREEQRRGCTPKPIPPLRVALAGPPQGDYAVVDVFAGPNAGVLVLMRVDGGWRIDTYRSDVAAIAS